MKAFLKRLHHSCLNKAVLTIFSFFVSALAFAQDTPKKIDIDANGQNAFFGSPWIWVVGIVVFVLLLIALLRGSGRRSDA